MIQFTAGIAILTSIQRERPSVQLATNVVRRVERLATSLGAVGRANRQSQTASVQTGVSSGSSSLDSEVLLVDEAGYVSQSRRPPKR